MFLSLATFACTSSAESSVLDLERSWRKIVAENALDEARPDFDPTSEDALARQRLQSKAMAAIPNSFFEGLVNDTDIIFGAVKETTLPKGAGPEWQPVTSFNRSRRASNICPSVLQTINMSPWNQGHISGQKHGHTTSRSVTFTTNTAAIGVLKAHSIKYA